MRVVESGRKYKFYNNAITTYEQLPAKTYRVAFNDQEGFSLVETHDLEMTETKVYGQHLEKVDKVLNALDKVKRNLGVILSGDKGIGKSLFSKMLGIKAKENEVPVILVDEYIPGIANFLDDIEQTVMVLFDEYDKTFDENKYNCQAEMLSLFDGMSAGKKLFVITCNKIDELSSFLLNRPGRFHYHFRFAYPTVDEIQAYMEDKLEEQYYGEIENVIAFSLRMKLNYDCLRAIAFELNTGSSFKEAIEDLNILRMYSTEYIDIVVEFENGKILEGSVPENELYDGSGYDMDLHIPLTISKLYNDRDIGEMRLNFTDNYVDPEEKLIMFNFEGNEVKFYDTYTPHKMPDEAKSEVAREITKIIEENYSEQQVKRIFMAPKENKDEYRFFG